MRISVPDESWVAELADDGTSVVVWDLEQPQPDGHLDLVLVPYGMDRARLRTIDVSRIGVVQGHALGHDGVAEMLPRGAVYCKAVGVYEAQTAELAIALTLASQRRLDDFVRRQSHGTWQKEWSPTLIDRRVMVVGVGGIGREIVARLDGFGAEVVRVGANARTDERGTVHGTGELPSLLPTVDVVVVAVPLIASTRRLVDDAFLAALPAGALVVNVSRGAVADTGAVVRAAGRTRFAADVFDPEPLPAGHPLWSLPGILVTPHVGGMTTALRPRMVRLVREQVERLRRGEQPAHVAVRT